MYVHIKTIYNSIIPCEQFGIFCIFNKASLEKVRSPKQMASETHPH